MSPKHVLTEGRSFCLDRYRRKELMVERRNREECGLQDARVHTFKGAGGAHNRSPVFFLVLVLPEAKKEDVLEIPIPRMPWC